MSAITTIIASVAAAGAVALYRFVDRQTSAVREAFRNDKPKRAPVIDYERDPESGVFHPKNTDIGG